MVLSFAAIGRRRGAIVGAAGVAVATAIKLLPAIFGVYFLIRREWRAFASFVLLLAVTTVAVPAMFLGPRTAFALLGEFYQLQVGPYLSGESTQHAIYARTAVRKTQHDQDLGALLMRHFTAEHDAGGLLLARVNLRVVRSAMFGLFAVILAISVATAWPRAGDRVTEPRMTDLVFAVFVMLSLLLSPRNRMAYWTVLMIPWAVLLGRLMDGRTPTRSRRAGRLHAGGERHCLRARGGLRSSAPSPSDSGARPRCGAGSSRCATRSAGRRGSRVTSNAHPTRRTSTQKVRRRADHSELRPGA